jgi:transcriptional regulator with GAF, ATPase, and Fis domain
VWRAVSSREVGDALGSTRTETEFDPEARDARARPFLFLVLEAERPLAGGARFALEDVDEVLVGRAEGTGPRQAARSTVDGKCRLTIRAQGQFLSKDHALIRRDGRVWILQDLGSRNGVYVNGGKIEQPTPLGLGDLVSLGRLFFLLDDDETEPAADLDISDTSAELAGFLTLVPSLGHKLARLRREAKRSTPITLVGDTGTGKEVLAKAIHAASGRTGPYLAVNCGSIPKDLIQSELFGHAKGAFSGATEARSGYLRDGHQETLLLDEIVAAPPAVQVALLRAIQEKAVTPVGSTRTAPVDVRFIAAAQKPLNEAVELGLFREDLQARLEGFVFELPPLCERPEDIGILIAHTLRTIGVEEKDNPRFSWRAATRILRYEWPRNIRELAKAVDRAWGGAKDGEIDESDLPKANSADASPRARLKQQLIAGLRAARGNVAEVARKMGRTRPLIYHYLKRFEIDPDSFR